MFLFCFTSNSLSVSAKKYKYTYQLGLAMRMWQHAKHAKHAHVKISMCMYMHTKWAKMGQRWVFKKFWYTCDNICMWNFVSWPSLISTFKCFQCGGHVIHSMIGSWSRASAILFHIVLAWWVVDVFKLSSYTAHILYQEYNDVWKHPHGSQRHPNISSHEGAHILYPDICTYFSRKSIW